VAQNHPDRSVDVERVLPRPQVSGWPGLGRGHLDRCRTTFDSLPFDLSELCKQARVVDRPAPVVPLGV
jgi:hypothetical protein